MQILVAGSDAFASVALLAAALVTPSVAIWTVTAATASNQRSKKSAGPRLEQGFTLLELIVVVAIMALATAGVSLALRDPEATALEREAERLSALLETGRSQSRATGLPVRWESTAEGYVLMMPSGDVDKPIGAPTAWLNPQTVASSNGPVSLGPEPIIAAQSITLRLLSRSLVIATDGLRPFALQSAEATPQR